MVNSEVGGPDYLQALRTGNYHDRDGVVYSYFVGIVPI